MKREPYQKLADQLVEAIASLEDPSLENVLKLWQENPAKPDDKCSAFWLMDEKPGMWPNWNKWHPHLRQLRNSPTYGDKLFETFRG